MIMNRHLDKTIENFILNHYEKIDINDNIYFFISIALKMTLLLLLLSVITYIVYKFLGVNSIFNFNLLSLTKMLMSNTFYGIFINLCLFGFNKLRKN